MKPNIKDQHIYALGLPNLLRTLQTNNVPLPTELPGTASLSTAVTDAFVLLTLQLAPEAVNKSGCKVGFEVGIGLCLPIPTITKLYGSVLASILGPPSFVIVI